MKKINSFCLIIILFISITSHSKSQRITTLSTKELYEQIVKDGLDNIFDNSFNYKTFLDLYEIDVQTTMDLILLDLNIKYRNNSYDLLLNTALHIKNEIINNKLFEYYKNYKTQILSETLENSFTFIDMYLFRALIKQNHDSLKIQLKDDYIYWKNLSSESLKECPGWFSEFILSLVLSHPACRYKYNCCKINEYAVAWTLNKLGDPDFSKELVMKLDSNYEHAWAPDYDEFIDSNSYYFSFTILLSKPVKSLWDLDIYSEIEWLKNNYYISINDKCWVFNLINDKNALIDCGCIFGPLSGSGTTFKVELIESMKLRIYIIDGWIS